MFNQIEVLLFLLSLILAVSEFAEVLNNHNCHAQDGNRGKHIERKRQPVKSIFTNDVISASFIQFKQYIYIYRELY